jgi:hypothetical protein
VVLEAKRGLKDSVLSWVSVYNIRAQSKLWSSSHLHPKMPSDPNLLKSLAFKFTTTMHKSKIKKHTKARKSKGNTPNTNLDTLTSGSNRTEEPLDGISGKHRRPASPDMLRPASPDMVLEPPIDPALDLLLPTVQEHTIALAPDCPSHGETENPSQMCSFCDESLPIHPSARFTKLNQYLTGLREARPRFSTHNPNALHLPVSFACTCLCLKRY